MISNNITYQYNIIYLCTYVHRYYNNYTQSYIYMYTLSCILLCRRILLLPLNSRTLTYDYNNCVFHCISHFISLAYFISSSLVSVSIVARNNNLNNFGGKNTFPLGKEMHYILIFLAPCWSYLFHKLFFHEREHIHAFPHYQNY